MIKNPVNLRAVSSHCPRRAGVSSVKKDPLRVLTSSERRALEQLARSQSAPAASVARDEHFLPSAMAARTRKQRDSWGAPCAIRSRNGWRVSTRLGWLRCATAGSVRPGGARTDPERISPPTGSPADGTATWSLNTLRSALCDAHRMGCPTSASTQSGARCTMRVSVGNATAPGANGCGHAQAQARRGCGPRPGTSAKKA